MAKEIDATAAAAWLKAVSNPARLRIVFCLLKGETSVAELERQLKIRQPNLSQHLAELRNAKIAVARREFKSAYYSLASDEARRFASGLMEIFGGSSARPIVSEPRRESNVSNQAAVFVRLHAS
ncbi:helix-turn-helix transcriptional regulator [Methyloceanibacter sp. wino2]|uniref:ArsR/SmtB family transcription factor n=1 Tax=Methyloceanibacter sp. wino2 TaxID=2170729 RepID=UPI000D3E868C|nr:metalloregulator ArsR/SmtB family transcription factor [Methyloceanibacter sp. wino2]